jgi:esterase/lipase superfamily enzyme
MWWCSARSVDLRDDRLRLQRVENQDRDAYFSEIRQTMQAAREGGEQPHALVFLHGFNVTFEDAAIRAAQIGYDLKVPGATAFFSWPSRGSVAAYPADEASLEASELSVTVGEGTTFSAMRGPVRNDCVSAAWYRPLLGHGFSQELT